tara:strand:+ start:1641 stop:3167 length:1527 start_codon:yes stop_codon:yes gene_type:complete
MNKRQQPDLTSMIGMGAGEAQDQRVETEILEPASVSQNQVTFLLPQKGLLSDDAFLSFKMTTVSTDVDIPSMAGATGLIRRASIYYGNVLLQETDQAAHLLQLKSTYVDQDVRNQTYQTKTGHFSGLKVDSNAAGRLGFYSIDAANDDTGITGLLVENGNLNYNKDPAFKLQTTAAATPEWTIPLKWFFNWLTQTQVPLGLLNERITIVIDFNEDLPGMRSVINDPVGANNPWQAGTQVVESSVRLSLDLIYYDDQPGKPSPMSAIAAAVERGMEMVYTDYVAVEEFIPALAAQPAAPQNQQKIVRLALDHQVCRNILISTPRQSQYTVTTPDGFSNPILGDYNSLGSQGQRTLQVKINNQNLFVNALDMDCKLYNELSQVMSVPMKANIGQTSAVGQLAAGATLVYDINQQSFPDDKFFYGHPMGGSWGGATNNTTFSNSLAYMGVNLARTYDNVLGAGTNISKSPVEVELNYTRTEQNWRQLRMLLWCENERLMMIKNGTIYVSGS